MKALFRREHKSTCPCPVCQRLNEDRTEDAQELLEEHVSTGKKLTNMLDLVVTTLEKEKVKREEAKAVKGLHGRPGHPRRS